MYKRPADPAAFDRYYYATHVPIAKKIPGCAHYEVTTRHRHDARRAAAPYHLIATLTFDSLAAIQAALGTPEGQATAADLGNFATGGVDLFIADTEDDADRHERRALRRRPACRRRRASRHASRRRSVPRFAR